jgi:hypothetical protein
MRRLLLIGSAAALLAVPAIAPAFAEETEHDAATHEAMRDVNADGELETLKNGYTDQHPWVDASVWAEGERVGEIERVHFSGDAIDRIVIEYGGLADVGGREVEVPLTDGELTFSLNVTKAQLDEMPAFDEARASDFPLSDNPLEDLDYDETPAQESSAAEAE